MSYIIVADSELAKRNQSLLVGISPGILYNAVLSVTFNNGTITEPVTLQEAKDWCRIDIDDDDILLGLLMIAARQVCENHANISMVERTVTARIMNGLGGQQLPYGPVIAIQVATDFNGDDILTDFSLDTAYGDPITLQYTAGYTDGNLPQNLRHAILNQIAWMYENRGDTRVEGAVSELSKLLLNQVRSV